MLAVVQLPDGASLDRTQRVLKQVGEISAKNSAVDQVITIAGVSALDNSSSSGQRWNCVFDLEGLERPGRRRGFALAGLWAHPETGVHTGGAGLVLPPPPIQGIGNAAGFAMQLELRDGNSDFGKLQAITTRWSPMRRRRARCSV